MAYRMDKLVRKEKKFPKTIYYTFAIYSFVLIWGISNLLVPIFYFGLFFTYLEFTLPITILVLLPLILFILYIFDYKFPVIQRNELAVRLAITAFTVVAFLVVFLFTQ